MSNLSQFTGGLLKFNKNQRFQSDGASAQSAAFDSDTVAIIIASVAQQSQEGFIEIGANPTATSSSFVILSSSNSSSSDSSGFTIGPIGVEAGDKIAGFNAGATYFHIMELKY